MYFLEKLLRSGKYAAPQTLYSLDDRGINRFDKVFYDEALRIYSKLLVFQAPEQHAGNWDCQITSLSSLETDELGCWPLQRPNKTRSRLENKIHIEDVLRDLGLFILCRDGELCVQQDYQGSGIVYIRTADACVSRHLLTMPDRLEETVGIGLFSVNFDNNDMGGYSGVSGMSYSEGFSGLNIEPIIPGAPPQVLRCGEMIIIPIDAGSRSTAVQVGNHNKNQYEFVSIVIAGREPDEVLITYRQEQAHQNHLQRTPKRGFYGRVAEFAADVDWWLYQHLMF